MAGARRRRGILPRVVPSVTGSAWSCRHRRPLAQRRLCLCYQDDASLSPAMRRYWNGFVSLENISDSVTFHARYCYHIRARDAIVEVRFIKTRIRTDKMSTLPKVAVLGLGAMGDTLFASNLLKTVLPLPAGTVRQPAAVGRRFHRRMGYLCTPRRSRRWPMPSDRMSPTARPPRYWRKSRPPVGRRRSIAR